MIRLTRLNNTKLAINSDLIKFVENSPDTVITLTTGEKVMVREAIDEIIARVVEFRQALLCHISAPVAGIEGQMALESAGPPPGSSMDAKHHG
jgi:flagellar protein FlbD